ncbi:MAG: metallophosphoesterase [Candidatus Shapirobacteria bacterium]
MKRGWKRCLTWGLVILVVAGVVWWWKSSPKPDQKIEEKKTEEVVKMGEEIRFGVMADVHMDWNNFKMAIDLAKSRGEKQIVVAGDLTSVGSKKELMAAKKVLDQSGMLYFVVPGNHDRYTGDKFKEDIFGEVFGKSYQSLKEGSLKLILIDNGGKAGLGWVQTEWLKKEVDECRVWVCVAVMHMPLENNFSEHVMGEGSTAVTAEAAELVKMLKETGVKEIVAGHLHYASAYEIDGMRTILVGSVAEARNTQTPRFTELTVKDNILNREVVVLEDTQ